MFNNSEHEIKKLEKLEKIDDTHYMVTYQTVNDEKYITVIPSSINKDYIDIYNRFIVNPTSFIIPHSSMTDSTTGENMYSTDDLKNFYNNLLDAIKAVYQVNEVTRVNSYSQYNGDELQKKLSNIEDIYKILDGVLKVYSNEMTQFLNSYRYIGDRAERPSYHKYVDYYYAESADLKQEIVDIKIKRYIDKGLDSLNEEKKKELNNDLMESMYGEEIAKIHKKESSIEETKQELPIYIDYGIMKARHGVEPFLLINGKKYEILSEFKKVDYKTTDKMSIIEKAKHAFLPNGNIIARESKFGGWGIIDPNGNIIVDFKYESISPLINSDGNSIHADYLVVESKEKNDSTEYLGSEDKYGDYMLAMPYNYQGIINQDGTELFPIGKKSGIDLISYDYEKDLFSCYSHQTRHDVTLVSTISGNQLDELYNLATFKEKYANTMLQAMGNNQIDVNIHQISEANEQGKSL